MLWMEPAVLAATLTLTWPEEQLLTWGQRENSIRPKWNWALKVLVRFWRADTATLHLD